MQAGNPVLRKGRAEATLPITYAHCLLLTAYCPRRRAIIRGILWGRHGFDGIELLLEGMPGSRHPESLGNEQLPITNWLTLPN